jgi:hypothetical protein
MKVRTPWAWSLAIVGALGLAVPLQGQERGPDRIVPTNAVVITGYGTLGYAHRPADGESAVPSAFQASFSPIFLFQFQDRILFQGELEFEIEEGVTETSLEFAQADVILTDNLSLTAGKFLLPFGVFGRRLHPSWINKMATTPPLFGHDVTGFGAEPLLAIPADVGVMAQAAFAAGDLQIGLNGYITQGYQAEEHDEGGGEAQLEEEEVPGFGLPASSEDLTNNKMVGGRLDIALPPWAEINFSAFGGKYDERDLLDLTAFNVAAELRRSGLEFRAEYLRTRQEFEGHEGLSERVRSGVYTQLSYRVREWESVLRFTKIFDDEIDGIAETTAATQLAIGLDYWIGPSVAVISSYEFNREDALNLDNDRLNIHLAFGF